MKASEQHA
ncbi:hypothetical protein CGLO_11209 [Colletotrichum gloeosporioides Cg-14]|uniref:Uncharacterized protein n=1 Tax=Colletotrichum gloeosporioides (strain Cg-14) TaxID=1237896 RepID=T0KBP0_COLGC|nr:hypothetical protein CGLO_11209 [Colletotrichum gloeosporioides Cg-14]